MAYFALRLLNKVRIFNVIFEAGTCGEHPGAVLATQRLYLLLGVELIDTRHDYLDVVDLFARPVDLKRRVEVRAHCRRRELLAFLLISRIFGRHGNI